VVTAQRWFSHDPGNRAVRNLRASPVVCGVPSQAICRTLPSVTLESCTVMRLGFTSSVFGSVRVRPRILVAGLAGVGLYGCPGPIPSPAEVLAKEDAEWLYTGQTRGGESARASP